MEGRYSPFGSFAIGEFLSPGFLLLLMISNRGPEGFRGESASAFSYSVILSLGGGDDDAALFNLSASTALSSLTHSSERVA
jgi:hypothetical protein